MNKPDIRAGVILLVEDDPDDQELVKRAVGASAFAGDLRIVSDGEEALEYLYRRGDYSFVRNAPRPDLILLDLNMPKLDGRAVLSHIKADPELRSIPVVILTTSSREEDVCQSYELGVNSYITKPDRMDGFIKTVHDLEHYWFHLVMLPDSG